LFNRYSKRAVIILHDLVMTGLALVAALSLRFDEVMFDQRLVYWRFALPFILLAGVVYTTLRLYRSKWRFASVADLIAIAKASAVLALALLVIDYVVLAQNLFGGYFFGRQAIVIYFILQVAFLGAPRLFFRAWKDGRTRRAMRAADAPPVLLVGRPSEAEGVLRGVETGTVRAMHPVAVISPRLSDGGQRLREVTVRGGIDALSDELDQAEARGEAIRRLVLLPSALEQDAEPERVMDLARRRALPVVRMQSLDEAAAPSLKPVEIEDLLLRPSHMIDDALVRSFVAGKRCVVTGGGGSIGGEICRRLKHYGAAAILILEISELAIHTILEDLGEQAGTTTAEGRLADVRDAVRTKDLVVAFKPDIVFHAAALKHVPFLEQDWGEGIRTNILGSIAVAEAAIAAKAACMVMISTDKAIQPVSMLGATKRFAEIATEAMDRDSKLTRLVSVRFGNVLGSNGSVVPKFKAQIARGGPVTVTHPDMIRYFMTVREACDLVLTAGSHGAAQSKAKRPASVYVLKMGQPVRIVDLARRMITLSGLQPDVDIAVRFTGVRPGERLHEILFDEGEALVETGLDGVMAAQTIAVSQKQIAAWVNSLGKAMAKADMAAANAVLMKAVPDYRPGGQNGLT
jgi:FlaA1/EpsC-like NDP-sugar epimerase